MEAEWAAAQAIVAADEYASFVPSSSARGTPIGANDSLIAAIARHHDLTLVTNNVK